MLHYAVANCNAETIVEILQKGADVSQKNMFNMLPVEVAIEQKRSKYKFFELMIF